MTREEAIKELSYIADEMPSMECADWKEAISIAIKALKQEPKKGHWIEHPHECGINWEYSMYECSECHEWTEDNSDFCPNCGAYMREDWD